MSVSTLALRAVLGAEDCRVQALLVQRTTEYIVMEIVEEAKPKLSKQEKKRKKSLRQRQANKENRENKKRKIAS